MRDGLLPMISPLASLLLGVIFAAVLAGTPCFAADDSMLVLVCNFEPVDLGQASGIARFDGVQAPANPAHITLQICASCQGPFGGSWTISDTSYYSDGQGVSITIDRYSGSATYTVMGTATEGTFPINHPGQCTKRDKPVF